MAAENTLPSVEASPASEASAPTVSPTSPAETPAGGPAPSAPTGADGAPLPPYAAAESPSAAPEASPAAEAASAAGASGVSSAPPAADQASAEAASAAGASEASSTPPAAADQTSAEVGPATDPSVTSSTSPDTGPASPAAIQPVSPSELTSTVGVPQAPNGEMSVKDMFLNADPVVQGVMLLLLAASVATWVIIFEKTFILRNTSRNIMLFKRASAGEEGKVAEKEFPPLTRSIVEAGLRESRDAAGNETRCDYRERVERSMRAELSGLMDRVGYRVMFLATVGAVSPFVGLFGTVWGIMHSFVGIAASGETTLAVVAPGIAEALFATAMGLVAAIPAVIAYNKITGTMKKITKEALSGIGFLGNRLARSHFSGPEA